MSLRTEGTLRKDRAAKILGVQFSILSPEEIRKTSVAQITSRDTYVNNKPVLNGLFDPRMGVLEPGLVCPTDGLDYMQTPGYFGHIELAKPLFYIQYLATVIKVVRCTCVKCSKLLIDKERHAGLMDLPPLKRWQQVFALASKVKRCGEETDDGCGYKQPSKVKKEGLATLTAEWDSIEGLEGPEASERLTLTLTPEIVLKQLRRISDQDVTFMGFSPVWSRPDWMVCQVLAVPPPAVRPSVKHDSQQRSEDDLSHIIVNIIKANTTLQEKIDANAAAGVIADWRLLLQYYVATLVDNKLPGVQAQAQRSGRPLKSIKERLNGKGGRVRGNLMGKRVDFSARSVITPDPNLSIRELGVPMRVAMNLTQPVRVNQRNRAFLTTLARNGPDEYPGAKVLERRNGDSISLRYVDRQALDLDEGDTVHRHLMDGDAVLFNRQPTLHRMSMMCHTVRVMPQGDTFRMNVGDTKPYNADFDGDEMNLHAPQDVESISELRNLAAVPWQMISPANNKSIVGVFQDSLLGAYRLTRADVRLQPREAMNLLMAFDKIDISRLPLDRPLSGFELLSQILPPLTLKYKTKRFKDGEDKKTANTVLEIVNGQYVRGQMEKGVLGDGSKGLIQRICNDFGNMESAAFVDNLQDVVTAYMSTSSFSVGISDLMADKATSTAITEVIASKKREVQSLIDETHLGIFENASGRTDQQEFEMKVNNILNRASKEAGRIGRDSLSQDNRFVTMVNAGSKGSELNISQMISCLGQQNVDGKRIPYGFQDRTLPHFTKFDDSPGARGFVENSFISGLSPTELFFHAMGGRVGLIDTAVKTSQTGYIQRRLVKGLEDLKVDYDMTVRNGKQKIIQFSYGDDGFDPTRVENQVMPLVKMSLEEIYARFQLPLVDGKRSLYTEICAKNVRRRITKQQAELIARSKKAIDHMVEARAQIVEDVFEGRDNMVIHIPVAFTYLVDNVRGQQMINEHSTVDITPLECFRMIDKGFEDLKAIAMAPPSDLFEVAYYYHLAPMNLLLKKRFNRVALAALLSEVSLAYKQAIVAPGEMVGIIAAQSIGEPTTQMTLNTFHFAGVASKSNVTRGVPRIEEILTLSENPKNPSCTVRLFPPEEAEQDSAQAIMHRLEHTQLSSVVKTVQICFDPSDSTTQVAADAQLLARFQAFENELQGCLEAGGAAVAQQGDSSKRSKWIVRLELDPERLLDHALTVDDVHFAISSAYGDSVECVFSDYNDDNLVFRLRLTHALKKIKRRPGTRKHALDQADEVHELQTFQGELLDKLILRGVKGIGRVIPRKVQDEVVEQDGSYERKDVWVLDTVGTNLLGLLALDYIDVNRTFTNDIQEVYRVLGIEAARQAIFNELSEVIEFDSTYINYHHLSVLCDRMTCNDKMVSIFRHGINNDDIGPIAKASFEETPEMFLRAARHGELDPMRGVSANVMCGQEGYFGTSAFQVLLDTERLPAPAKKVPPQTGVEAGIDAAFQASGQVTGPCAPASLGLANNAVHVPLADTGGDDGYEPDF